MVVQALNPGRGTELEPIALHQDELLVIGQVMNHQVFPFAVFGNEAQVAPIRGKLRLLDGAVRGEVNRVLFSDVQRGASQRSQFEARAVPGHMGMVPFDPGQHQTRGMPHRLHVEIGPGGQLNRPITTLAVHQGDQVFFAVRPDVSHPLSVGRKHRAGRHPMRRGDRARAVEPQPAAEQAPAALDKKQPALRHAEIAAAVAYLSAHRMLVGQVEGRLAFG